MYEASPARASSGRAQDSAVALALTGGACGIAVGFLMGELGVPHIFALSRLALLPPMLVLGAILGLTKLRSVLPGVAAVLLAIVSIIALTPVMHGAARRLIRSDPLPASADAVVVLSAGVSMDGMLNQQGLDRLLKGIELVKAGVAPRLVLTRERKRLGSRYITSAADQTRLIRLGGATEVISSGLVTSTREEALRIREIAQRSGWTRVVLVTSPLHARRACATFEKAGLVVSCIPSDSRDIALNSLQGPDNRLRAFGMWIYELAGTLRYWQAGWI
jgi:uncharacterized SAM-binding protein YcdF (DUF218 family)